MSEKHARTSESGRADAIVAYKTILRDVIEQRPSGTRHRLAKALGKARSFVSQITSPAYATAIPVQHLPTIFEIIHFSAVEKARFVAAYREAHPQHTLADAPTVRRRTLQVMVPDLGDASLNTELDQLVETFWSELIRLSTRAIELKVDQRRKP